MNMEYRKFFVFIGSIILFATVSLAAEQKVYVVGINNNNNTLEIQDIAVTVTNLFEERALDEASSYRIELVSPNNTVLYKAKFDFALIYEYKEITIPYFPTGKEIRIYDKDGNILLNESVINFADTCGNNICDPHESYESCPKDCPSGAADDYCDAVEDSICDPDCTANQDADCSAPAADSSRYIAAAVATVGLIVILLVLYYRKKRSAKSVERILEKMR